jgi:hypothetical protein
MDTPPRPATRSAGLDDLLAAARTDVAQFAAAVSAALEADPIPRVQAARRLAENAAHILARLADAAVVEATRTATYEEVAAALGVHRSAVGKAVMRINGREVSRGSRGQSDTR